MNLLERAMEAVILEAISKGYSKDKIIDFMKTEIFEEQVKLYLDKFTELSS